MSRPETLTRWEQDDDDFVREMWGRIPAKDIGEALDRTVEAIYKRAAFLKLKHWTELRVRRMWEDKFIKIERGISCSRCRKSVVEVTKWKPKICRACAVKDYVAGRMLPLPVSEVLREDDKDVYCPTPAMIRLQCAELRRLRKLPTKEEIPAEYEIPVISTDGLEIVNDETL